MNYPKLFSPMKIGNVEIKNRIVQTAMGVDVNNPDGTISDRAIAYYAERAKNNVGLIITEYCRVNENDGVSAVGQMSLASDKHIEGVKKLVDAIHDGGAKVFIQLQHPGRQTVPIFPTFWPAAEALGRTFPHFWKKYNEVVTKATEGGMQGGDEQEMKKMQRFLRPNLAPSKLPEGEPDVALWYIKHRAMTIYEIHKLERQFIDAAIRAKAAGADGIELHATHGYLLQQFLSPFTNRRTDEYGGSFENRARIVKELIEGIKAACGKDFPISVRLTVDEFEELNGHPERGYHLEEGVRLAKEFEKYGADAIDVSIGATDTIFLFEESMRYPVGWRKYLSKAVKEAVNIPVIAVGVIRTPSQAEQQLVEGDQDFIGLARPLLADPQWATKAMEGREGEISRCIGCMRCMESADENMLTTNPPECSLNPRLCKEIEVPVEPQKDGGERKVAVIGAGVAGLAAAKELASRGFDVTVFEKEKVAGGQLNIADKPPMKDRIIWASNDLLTQAKAAGATVKFGEEATVENIKALNPECVIAATGGYAAKPSISGSDASYVCTITEVLNGSLLPEGKNVVVAGTGLTGLETAELLIKLGNKVTLVGRPDKLAPKAGTVMTQEIVSELEKTAAAVLTGHTLQKIVDHKVVLTTKDGEAKEIDADLVVLALGTRSETRLADLLEAEGMKVIRVGDANKPGRIVHAVKDAFNVARTLK